MTGLAERRTIRLIFLKLYSLTRVVSVDDMFGLLGKSISNRFVCYSDVIMGAMASQITSLTIVYSTVYSGTDQRKHQSSALIAFVWGIHRWAVNSPHKWPVTRKMFPIDGVIMIFAQVLDIFYFPKCDFSFKIKWGFYLNMNQNSYHCHNARCLLTPLDFLFSMLSH